MKLGFEQAKSTQEYQILANIVSVAFGGKKPKQKAVRTFDEALHKFGTIFGLGKKSE